MDKINFTAADNFPLSSDTMETMQRMIYLSAASALPGGSNYILSGCVDDGTNVSDGVVVVNGEALPFRGGAKGTKITISETRRTLTAFGVDYPESYVFRTAKFSASGEHVWADFARVPTNGELQRRIESITGDAPGTVKMWAGRTARIPSEYRLCDGAVLPIDDYPELYGNVGTSFGGDGVGGFALPDLRGRFIVGYDSAKNDYKTIGADGKGGAETVLLSEDEIPAHNHTSGGVFDKLSAKASDIDAAGTPGAVDGNSAETEYNVARMSQTYWQLATMKSFGGNRAHENRPPYFVLAYIIKVK